MGEKKGCERETVKEKTTLASFLPSYWEVCSDALHRWWVFSNTKALLLIFTSIIGSVWQDHTLTKIVWWHLQEQGSGRVYSDLFRVQRRSAIMSTWGSCFLAGHKLAKPLKRGEAQAGNVTSKCSNCPQLLTYPCRKMKGCPGQRVPPPSPKSRVTVGTGAASAPIPLSQGSPWLHFPMWRAHSVWHDTR